MIIEFDYDIDIYIYTYFYSVFLSKHSLYVILIFIAGKPKMKKKKKTNNFLTKRETILPKYAVLFSLTNPRHLSLKFLHSTSLKYETH